MKIILLIVLTGCATLEDGIEPNQNESGSDLYQNNPDIEGCLLYQDPHLA
jgi:hypothetical protein